MPELRIHIGNISPKLAENPTLLETRLQKFGTIVSSLELKCKPLGDHYFGFVTMDFQENGFQNLKKTLHDVLFMGKKIQITESKPKYNWEADNNRPDTKKGERAARERIAKARDERIEESQTTGFVNSITKCLTHSNYINANSESLGYMKSSHVSNSANTKNKPPSASLQGRKSYSTSKISKIPPQCSSISRTSGHGPVIKGRHRTTARSKSDVRNATLRILINGELKTYKHYKSKLWGYDNSKTVHDLTWKFEDGVWKSGDDHIVERVVKPVKPISCAIGAVEAANYGSNADNKVAKDIKSTNSLPDIGISQEKEKNAHVLASLFSSYDFDKPLSLEEDQDEDIEVTIDKKGRKHVKEFDFEIEGSLDAKEGEDEDSESEKPVDFEIAKSEIDKYTKTHEFKEEVYYSENDEGNDMDIDVDTQSTETIKAKYEQDHQEEDHQEEDHQEEDRQEAVEDESDSEEFIPTFGANANAPPVNDTETLRELFKKSKQSVPAGETEAIGEGNQDTAGFKLNLSDDDIDKEKAPNEEEEAKLLQEILKKQEEAIQQFNEKRKTQFGLFWTHANSPFLSAQAQLRKLPTDVLLPGETETINETETGTETKVTGSRKEADHQQDESAYEKWFWSQRGELSRECKRRRRDVIRSFNKKSASVGGV